MPRKSRKSRQIFAPMARVRSTCIGIRRVERLKFVDRCRNKCPSLGNLCIFSAKRTFKICNVCNVAEYQNRWQASRDTAALVKITPTFSPLQRQWSLPDIVWWVKRHLSLGKNHTHFFASIASIELPRHCLGAQSPTLAEE